MTKMAGSLLSFEGHQDISSWSNSSRVVQQARAELPQLLKISEEKVQPCRTNKRRSLAPICGSRVGCGRRLATSRAAWPQLKVAGRGRVFSRKLAKEPDFSPIPSTFRLVAHARVQSLRSLRQCHHLATHDSRRRKRSKK
jgi:hypothetical protein